MTGGGSRWHQGLGSGKSGFRDGRRGRTVDTWFRLLRRGGLLGLNDTAIYRYIEYKSHGRINKPLLSIIL